MRPLVFQPGVTDLSEVYRATFHREDEPRESTDSTARCSRYRANRLIRLNYLIDGDTHVPSSKRDVEPLYQLRNDDELYIAVYEIRSRDYNYLYEDVIASLRAHARVRKRERKREEGRSHVRGV